MLLMLFMADQKCHFNIYENRFLNCLNCSTESIIRRQAKPSFTDFETILILFNGLFLFLSSSYFHGMSKTELLALPVLHVFFVTCGCKGWYILRKKQ